jgi:hypothetical protein
MSSEGYERRADETFVIVDECDRGRHDLAPRYDFVRMGSIVERTYLGESCKRCGHWVPCPGRGPGAGESRSGEVGAPAPPAGPLDNRSS